MSKAAERLNKLRTGTPLLNLGMDVEITENFGKRCFSHLSSEKGRRMRGAGGCRPLSQEFSSTQGQDELEGDMWEQLFFKLGDSLLTGSVL